MKLVKHTYCLLATLLGLFCISCVEENENNYSPQTYNVSGKVEKGPFVSGSAITIQPMSADMQALGTTYTSTIQDHLGNFSFGSKLFESPYAELTANGYFFNEVTGALSSGTLYLRAIVDLSKNATVNVNILTHLKYQRILNLIAEGKTYSEANNQAQKELLTAFGLQKYVDTDASQYSIIEGTDEAAALIAISSIILVDRTEAAATEYLAKMCREFGNDGRFSEETNTQIKADRAKLVAHLSDIRSNIKYRYSELGIEVEVRNLAAFFDWDDDGIAGNETLEEGEHITLETNRIDVPCSGGTYTIRIESPITVYTEPLVIGNLDMTPEDVYVDNSFYESLYSFSKASDEDIAFENSIKDNVVAIVVEPLESYRSKSAYIELYDCMGAILDTITIVQDANPNIAPPQLLGLGETAKQVVASMAKDLGKAFSSYAIIEQYYHYNMAALVDHSTSLVDSYLLPSSSTISNIWESFYRANSNNVLMRYYDEQALALYTDKLAVFSAMIYYNMVVAWGDVPYNTDYDNLMNGKPLPRTEQDEILDDLEQKLIVAVNSLEEKKNEPLSDGDDFFFVSKDVARTLLANIYMYRGKYAEAQMQLQDIINAGFYTLDASNYSNTETIDRLLSDRTSSELIFAFDASGGTRATRAENIVIRQPLLIPTMTYTDVILSYAECLFYAGGADEADKYLRQVVDAKNISVSDDLFTGIKEARQQLLLYSIGNLAFYKRNGIAVDELGIKDYQQLLPIPQAEMDYNPNMIQNPGY